MRFLTFTTMLVLAISSVAAEKSYLGVFSNQAEGFGNITLMVGEGGLAYLHGSVTGVVGKWKWDESSSKLSVTLGDPSSLDKPTIELEFDGNTRSYSGVTPGDDSPSAPDRRLNFVTDRIPKEVVSEFKAYSRRADRLKRKR